MEETVAEESKERHEKIRQLEKRKKRWTQIDGQRNKQDKRVEQKHKAMERGFRGMQRVNKGRK